MKSILKNCLVAVLGSQVRRLRGRNSFKIIGVVGSIGKTSTKLAIAKVLESGKRVRYQAGNYNDIVSVPLVFFDQKMPTLWNVFAWLKIIFQNEIKIYSDYPFDFVVLELGTDGPNQINHFRKYLHLDVAVLTAIAPEHMEFFGDMEEVAREEWSVSFFSDIVFVNKDICHIIPENTDHKKIIFYGKEFGAIYKIENVTRLGGNFNFEILYKGQNFIHASHEGVSEVEIYSICVAVAIAKIYNLSPEKIRESLNKITAFPGRMQKLKGIGSSIIIDDTYNASPEAMKMALDTLYAYPGNQKIAILGMMNELGAISEEEHKKVGKYCNPKSLDLVVTVGKDANLFLAPVARQNGCEVYEAKNALDAGLFVKDRVKEGAVILAKGSQNGVFTEEALKPILADPSDSAKLVRQDKAWMKKKRFLNL